MGEREQLKGRIRPVLHDRRVHIHIVHALWHLDALEFFPLFADVEVVSYLLPCDLDLDTTRPRRVRSSDFLLAATAWLLPLRGKGGGTVHLDRYLVR